MFVADYVRTKPQFQPSQLFLPFLTISEAWKFGDNTLSDLPSHQPKMSTMSLKIESDAEALVQSINDGTVDIHGIGIDVCEDVPVRDIATTSMFQLCEAIATDIFHAAGIHKHDAPESSNSVTTRVHNHAHRVESHEITGGYREDYLHPSHVMISMIAAIAYRKLRPHTREFFRKNEDLVKVFGELNGIQWLPIAIQVWAKVKSSPFAIELDQNCQKPVAKFQKVNGKSLWIVTTKMPDVNKYEEVFRGVFCPEVSAAGPADPKLEPSEAPLPSIEPNYTPKALITLTDDDDEMEGNAMTLRDYTRHMKILGKRLATPDRAVARRARREILKKPGEVQEQQVEEIGPPKEYFDSYTHLKDVWKTCLQNGVSIPNSLRILVDHHCTPSQVFHLTELEKEHQMEMEVDG
ncbi:uncharacterized protein FTJAE_8993 [Fusarium tjaetaba]|uniref:Uncharacterized protein n=1 Tax=Fusarium tjaetaba TaxID=1567544 RepID=A0A8H5R833_9HYPO|nr:uncharacterized protein FTJAE_8993 [Fusarium tjaetaba]KAF5628118.1 hypothetical protein FTJAE_8993 [Fusarium tjaetaba]